MLPISTDKNIEPNRSNCFVRIRNDNPVKNNLSIKSTRIKFVPMVKKEGAPQAEAVSVTNDRYSTAALRDANRVILEFSVSCSTKARLVKLNLSFML